MQAISNLDSKPKGGLWTSTYNEVYGSDWIKWLQQNDFIQSDNAIGGFYMTINKEAAIYTIDSYNDANALFEEYSYWPPFILEFDNPLDEFYQKNSHFFKCIDYQKLSDKFDGLHLTKQGFYDCKVRYSPCISPFTSFDCESTIWFNWCFDSIQYLKIDTTTSLDQN